MIKRYLKLQAVPLAILAVLVAVAGVSAAAHQRLKQERRAFSIQRYERLMKRIDVAIGSISETMISDGMAADLEEMRNRSEHVFSGEAAAEEPIQERVALLLTGVMWNETMPLAMINDQLVGKGDRVGDAEVVEVARLYVRMRYLDGGERVLALETQNE